MKYFRIVKITFLAACISFISGCNYLDLVPEGDATLETAFTNRVNSQKYLYTCYSYLPNVASPYNYPAMVGSDDMWWNYDYWTNPTSKPGMAIASGYQNANSPYLNYWDGDQGGSNMFQAIRDCNVFLDNIHKPYDIQEYERTWWIAEVKFLKAYYHFFLMQLYGPIPVIKENLPVSATPEEVRLYREPVENVIEYIVQLLDEAAAGLPLEYLSPINNAGRITKAVALSVKAKVLVWAASPLFNGNSEYSGFKDNKSRLLIPSGEPDIEKWKRAAVAIKNAIDTCHLSKHALYRYIDAGANVMSPEIQLNYTIRGAVTEKFNPEIVWPSTLSTTELQRACMPFLETGNYNTSASNELGATLKIAEQYYTINGLPIDEDPKWDYAGRYETQTAGEDHEHYIKTGQTSVKLHFDREPRFYASLGFDRGIFEGAGRTNEADYFYLQSRQWEWAGMNSQYGHLVTGYHIKKVINPKTSWVERSTTFKPEPYSFPIIRLSDLYLLYAEALNEAYGPSPEVYEWIDSVRHRAGIPGVEESYSQAATQYRNKPYEKETLREIIKRERLIELAFEGQRFWDLRRWKDALRYFNEPVRGWNYKSEYAESYYLVTNVWDKRVFNPRDYLWPLSTNSIIVNSNLKQNPGW
jgi:hypothetical protein